MKKELIILGIFLYVKQSSAAGSAAWDYDGDKGPDKWKDDYKECAKTAQSPINIVLDKVEYDNTLAAFSLTNFAKSAEHLLKNNGHTVQVDVGDDTMQVTGGSLGATFKVAQFHFHWGTSGSSGSEHTVNGWAYPLEVHIVTFNTKYSGLGEAADKPDGLAVLGFFFEESEIANCHYDGLLDKLASVANAGTNTTVQSRLLQFIYQTSMKRYYRYKGSLTTPPCYESVTWTVFVDTIKISSLQLAKFRAVYKDAGTNYISKNYRPVQPLNGRMVKANFPTGVNSAEHVFYNSGLVLMTLFISLYSRH